MIKIQFDDYRNDAELTHGHDTLLSKVRNVPNHGNRVDFPVSAPDDHHHRSRHVGEEKATSRQGDAS